MKKFLAVVLAALVIALGLWVALRVQQSNRQMQVIELLPKTTIALLHVSDAKRLREQWHASDLYALWREPAVQAWLEKPLAELAKKRGDQKVLSGFMALGPSNGFLALAALVNNDPKFVGGFHFDKSEAEARRFIEEREAPLLAKSGSATREKLIYAEHQIETVNTGHFALASVYDRNWFFASNDLATLKALLDRADRRTQNAASDSLRESEIFRAATKPLPDDYAGLFFIDPQPFVQRLLPVLSMTGQPGNAKRWEQLKEIRSLAGTFVFDQGKMREAIFVAMPKKGAGEKLARPSLASASKDAFFYSTSLTQAPADWQLSPSPQAALPAFFQQYAGALTHAGLTREDVTAAFGNELDIIGEWPAEARWPVFSLSLPVRDVARARKIAETLASVEMAGGGWTRSEKDGATYYANAGFGGFVPVHPTLAVSNRTAVLASETGTAETRIAGKGPDAGSLEKSPLFVEAEGKVPAGGSGFNYIDPRLLVERADAALRPLLLMGATIYPALGSKVDAAKLPPVEAITKHLSPIVMSQRYTGEGYLSESAGPVTFNEAGFGLAGAVVGAYLFYQRGLGGLLSPAVPTSAPSPTASPF